VLLRRREVPFCAFCAFCAFCVSLPFDSVYRDAAGGCPGCYREL